ncbi:unnamed protein product [Rotaria magnacalcarata]
MAPIGKTIRVNRNQIQNSFSLLLLYDIIKINISLQIFQLPNAIYVFDRRLLTLDVSEEIDGNNLDVLWHGKTEIIEISTFDCKWP